MNILLVVPKYNLSKNIDYTYAFPFGLAYISSAIKTKGYTVDCLNTNHYNGSIEELIIKSLNKKKYDILCSGGNALIYQVIKRIIDVAHKHKDKPSVIIGGPIITSEPELMFNLLNPDFAVVGEGEKTIIELLEKIKSNKDLSKVKGIIYKNEKKEVVLTKEREQIKDIESIPLPDFDGLEFAKKLDNCPCNESWTSQAFDYPRKYPILGSRGCPFDCSFCWHDMKFRSRTIKDIMKELKIAVGKYDINYIEIYDDCFSSNKKRIYEFCNEIKRLSKQIGSELKWSCQLIVSTVDEEMIKLMKDAGCDNISYGFESFSPIVLKSMRKPINPKQIDYALKITLKNNIGIQGNFIFGDIAETAETAKETLDYWKSCKEAQQISLGFVQPYPGSDLYRYCLNKGIIKSKVYYIQNQIGPDTRLNMTKNMTNEEFQDLNKNILDIFRKYFEFASPIHFHKMRKKTNIYEFDFKCPHCRQVTHYSNCLIENKFIYGFHLICRKCHMRSLLVGPIKKLAYKHYTKTRKVRNLYVRLKKSFRQKRI